MGWSLPSVSGMMEKASSVLGARFAASQKARRACSAANGDSDSGSITLLSGELLRRAGEWEGVPSTGTGTERRPVMIADLFTKYSQIADQEEKEVRRIVDTILPVLAWLGEPVVLRPKALGGQFEGFRSVSLKAGAIVVTTDHEGRVSSKRLSEFRTAECLAILNDALPELQRMSQNKGRAGQVKPRISLSTALGGSRTAIDKRSHHLLVSNSGGDCVGLRVYIRLPGGRSRSSLPCDLGRGKTGQVDLGISTEVGGRERLEVHVDCKDVDGRELHAEESVPLGGAKWHEVRLRRKN